MMQMYRTRGDAWYATRTPPAFQRPFPRFRGPVCREYEFFLKKLPLVTISLTKAKNENPKSILEDLILNLPKVRKSRSPSVIFSQSKPK